MINEFKLEGVVRYSDGEFLILSDEAFTFELFLTNKTGINVSRLSVILAKGKITKNKKTGNNNLDVYEIEILKEGEEVTQ